jgi:hypothetical protein
MRSFPLAPMSPLIVALTASATQADPSSSLHEFVRALQSSIGGMPAPIRAFVTPPS